MLKYRIWIILNKDKHRERPLDYTDRTLTCKDCNNEFTFTGKEQAFYAEKGFDNDPVRCKDCRDARKARSRSGGRGGGGGGRSGGGGGGRSRREMFDATCTECGVETQVPFRPTPGKSVLCRDCFSKSH